MTEMKVFELSEFGRAFATREKGKAVFESFQGMLDGQPAGQTEAIVDWRGVKAASPSFIDEFVGLVCSDEGNSLLSEGIIFTGSKPYTTELIDTILRRRGCELKYAPTLEAARAGEVSVLGAVTAESLNSA